MAMLRSLRNLRRPGDESWRQLERRIFRPLDIVKKQQRGALSREAELKQLVFLGCPGSGKGTYAARLGALLRIPHISMGDLLRESIADGPLAQAMKEGKLLPDAAIMEVLSGRLRRGVRAGEQGFILDGFPRTPQQAQVLDRLTRIDKVVNLRMREDVLVAKCLGRRTCRQCHRSFNLTDVDVAGLDGGPRIRMPPVLPPPGCESKMVVREDDREEVVRHRLRVYHEESEPVEEYYRRQGKLVEVHNEGGIAETWSSLLAELNLDRGGAVDASAGLESCSASGDAG